MNKHWADRLLDDILLGFDKWDLIRIKLSMALRNRQKRNNNLTEKAHK